MTKGKSIDYFVLIIEGTIFEIFLYYDTLKFTSFFTKGPFTNYVGSNNAKKFQGLVTLNQRKGGLKRSLLMTPLPFSGCVKGGF